MYPHTAPGSAKAGDVVGMRSGHSDEAPATHQAECRGRGCRCLCSLQRSNSNRLAPPGSSASAGVSPKKGSLQPGAASPSAELLGDGLLSPKPGEVVSSVQLSCSPGPMQSPGSPWGQAASWGADANTTRVAAYPQSPGAESLKPCPCPAATMPNLAWQPPVWGHWYWNSHCGSAWALCLTAPVAVV